MSGMIYDLIFSTRERERREAVLLSAIEIVDKNFAVSTTLQINHSISHTYLSISLSHTHVIIPVYLTFTHISLNLG